MKDEKVILSEVLEWKLCYARNPFLYFCAPEDYPIARGDDWEDWPYQYNAGPPNNVKCYILAVSGLSEPSQYFSVDQIREGRGWFLEYGCGYPEERIPSGITVRELLEIAEKYRLPVYVPLSIPRA